MTTREPSPQKLLVAALLASVLLSGCNYYQYMPNMQHVPLLRSKGEARLAVAGSVAGMEWLGGSEASGVEIQSAYALTNHLGLMFNSAQIKDSSGEDGTGGVGRVAELGVGYFHPLGKHWVVEGYVGIGRGEVHYPYRTLPFWRGFAQPSIGYASRNFDIGVACRFAYLSSGKTQMGEYPFMNLIPDAFGPIDTSPGAGRVMFEPGIIMRVGTKSLKLQVQYCMSENLGRPMLMLKENLSVGLQLNINSSFQKRALD
ncbi:MAG: hypothetical protein IPM46_07645 [Flavobacteriales bacterium]|nr:hypothetical protein [Flavobacteriales bacterium]